MEVLALCIALLVVLVIVGIVRITQVVEFTNDLKKQFPEAKVYVSQCDSSFLAVDFRQEQIVVGLHSHRGTALAREEPYQIVVPFRDIVKAEVLNDGTQVTSTNRGGQVLGVAVGTLALGGVGAVIGGLSGSSTTVDGSRRMSLRITVEDINRPTHDVTFFESTSKKGGSRGQLLFDEAETQIVQFAAHLDTAIRQAEQDLINRTGVAVSESDASLSLPSTATLAREIGDLWKLRQEGALTEDEFRTQKAKLMRASSIGRSRDDG